MNFSFANYIVVITQFAVVGVWNVREQKCEYDSANQCLCFMMQVTVVMGIISSILLHPKKCQRLYNNGQWFCIYPVDICLCGVIICLLIPQIVVVSCFSILVVPGHVLWCCC